jgi:hypothetical protein
MKYSILILPLLVSCFSNCQTCIIALKLKDAIYVGADSRIIGNNNGLDNRPDSVKLSICKIHTVGKFNFVLGGTSPDLSLYLLKRICDTAKNFTSVIRAFGNFKYRLAEEFQFIKEHNYINYKKIAGFPNDVISYAIFFGVDADTLFIKAQGFSIENIDAQKISVYSRINNDTMYAVGHSNEIAGVALKKETWQGDIQQVINKLIKIEVKAHPFEVGLPIDIIKVTRRKTMWLQKKQQCN